MREFNIIDFDPSGKIIHAITVERSENPDCPIVADLINDCLKKRDYEMALRIAEDSLKPRTSILTKIKNILSPSKI